MNSYLDLFIEESKEHLQSINDKLLELENEPESISIVNEVFRSAHTLKGMAATMGFEDMASLTHEMENVLDAVRNSKLTINGGIIDTIFKCVDLLEGMLHSIIQGEDGSADVSEVLEELRVILGGGSSKKNAGKVQKSEKAKSTISIELNEYDKTIIRQAKQGDHGVFWIQTTLDEACQLKAARAYMVMTALEKNGEIIKSVPGTKEIEEEQFEHSFEVVFITKKSKEEVTKLVTNVSEVKTAIVEEINIGTLNQIEKEEVSESTENKDGEGTDKKQNNNNTAKKATTNKTTIRVDIERLDVLMNLFSELVIDRGRLEQLSKELSNSNLTETVEHMSRISGDLQNIILNMRMEPVERVFNRFPRMVRDLARELNKKINLEIIGAETELDRTVIDEIGDPLVHLLRNSLDHGIESPSVRLSNGKSEEGTVQLKAYHSGNHVFIEIADDGNGINREKVINKALEKGIITEQAKATLTDKQVYELLFHSGFSTADKISDVSGRGVGLDVVKTKIESLGGSVSVDSTPKKGTTFFIQLPLTLSIISSMLVKIEDEMYAVPLSSIIETAVVKKEDIMHAYQQDVIDFRGKVVPLVPMKSIFNVPQNGENKKENEIPVVIVRKGDKMAALMVDSFIGQQEVVLKSLGKYLVNVFSVSGATILGNGQVALILDCNALIK